MKGPAHLHTVYKADDQQMAALYTVCNESGEVTPRGRQTHRKEAILMASKTRSTTRSKPTETRTISEAILQDLEKHGGSISSQALHRDIESRYGVKHLFRARAELGRKVRTGVVHADTTGRYWELTGRKTK